MHYGRTILELVVTQTIILVAFLVAPFDLIEEVGTLAAGALTMVFAGVVGSVLYARHRSRVGEREFGRKLETLRRKSAV